MTISDTSSLSATASAVESSPPQDPTLTAAWLARRSALWLGAVVAGVAFACLLYSAASDHTAPAQAEVASRASALVTGP